jgi:hypothetical protein
MDACIVPVKVTFDYNRVRMLLPIESFENYVKFFHHSQLDESLDTLTTSISLGGGRADYIESSVNGPHVDNVLRNDIINGQSSAECNPSSSIYSYSRIN